MKRFAEEPWSSYEDHFPDFPDVPVVHSFGVNKKDWTDKELRNLKIFRLKKHSKQYIMEYHRNL